MPFFIDMLAVNECVRTSPEWRHHCEGLASRGLSYAQSIAPVITGQYRAALYGRVVSNTLPDSVSGAPAAVVGNDVIYALAVEFQEPDRHLVLLHTLDQLARG